MSDMKNKIARSLLAGVLIGFGCIVYVLVENHVLGSFLFSLGLLTVILQGAMLYTGRVGYANTWPLVKDLVPVILLNFVGIWLTCFLFSRYSGLNLDTSALMAAKMNETWYQALVKSIGCGAMMFIAVDNFKKHNHAITVVLPIMCFILCGFEHCIADYGYMAMDGRLFVWQLPVWIVGNAIGSQIMHTLAHF